MHYYIPEQQPMQPQPPPAQPKVINHSLEAASKMVPVPESLMSPDYQDPIFDIQKTIPKNCANASNTSSQSSNSSVNDERKTVNKSLKGSPKLTKSATSSPKLKSKIERKGSLSKIEMDKKINGEFFQLWSYFHYDLSDPADVIMPIQNYHKKIIKIDLVIFKYYQDGWW